MGFLKYLLGLQTPCDVCQLGKSSWPDYRKGTVDWVLRDTGLNASLRICSYCAKAIRVAGLARDHPLMAVGILVRAGRAERPPVHAYLQHAEWRRVWRHMLKRLQINVADYFQVLAATKELEPRFFEETPSTDTAYVLPCGHTFKQHSSGIEYPDCTVVNCWAATQNPALKRLLDEELDRLLSRSPGDI
jgi:hypothetical protein